MLKNRPTVKKKKKKTQQVGLYDQLRIIMTKMISRTNNLGLKNSKKTK